MKIKVLIVEDEAILALTYRMGLDPESFVVTGIADTGEGAIEKAAADRPDIVLMDIKLKGAIDGIAAAEAIMEDYGTPVIYITGNVDKQTRERAYGSHPLAYLEKPVDVEDISGVIKQVMVA